MNRTSIEWTDFSANPLKFRAPDGRVVWACEKISDGCKHCYAEDLSHRYGGARRAGDWNAVTMATLTPFLDEAELHKMLTAKSIGGKAVSGSRCFIGDMTDIFGEWVSDDLLNRLFSTVLELRRDVTWQLLTKRADRLHRYLSWRYGPDAEAPRGRIPSRNIHVGVSVENQKYADERIPLLLHTPAAVRFISAEPLLGPVNLLPQWMPTMGYDSVFPRLDWVIVGGESGPGARPFDIAWARNIVRQCREAHEPFTGAVASAVPVFVKQLGAKPYDIARPSNVTSAERAQWMRDGWTQVISDDGECFTKHPRITDRKGGDPSEWPADLCVREFPR